MDPEHDPTVRLRTLNHVGYALLALWFISGITALIAVVLDYIKRDEARGTWLESHYRWRIRTFWWGLLWLILGALTALILIGWVILGVALVWYIYRVAKGWLYLNDGKPLAV